MRFIWWTRWTFPIITPQYGGQGGQYLNPHDCEGMGSPTVHPSTVSTNNLGPTEEKLMDSVAHYYYIQLTGFPFSLLVFSEL